VFGDTAVEEDETFFLQIKEVNDGGVVATGQATILNDDFAFGVTGVTGVTGETVAEGDSGDANLVTFTVTREGGTALPSDTFTVDFVSGTAVEGVDFEEILLLPTRFEAGESSLTFSVLTIGDDAVEGDESFSMNLTFGDGTVISGTSVIENDDLAQASAPVTDGDDAGPLNPVLGSERRDRLVGTEEADAIRTLGGSWDTALGGAGADAFVFGAKTGNGRRERNVIRDYEVDRDFIVLTEGATVLGVRDADGQVVVDLGHEDGGDGDVIYVRGDGVTADGLDFVTSDDPFGLF
jgi:hypothetical protein